MKSKKPTNVKLQTKKEVALIQDYNIDAFLDKRNEFIKKVNKIMVKGKDFHVIKESKSMAKGGAEKIASIFNWQASFKKDTDAINMLGDMKGLVAFICTLTKDRKFVGEGRGAALLTKNAGDPNKTIKMAQKSGFIDAVLRASGLSDFYTQDLEDMNDQVISVTNVKQPYKIVKTIKSEKSVFQLAVERIDAVQNNVGSLKAALAFIPKWPGLNGEEKDELTELVNNYISNLSKE